MPLQSIKPVGKSISTDGDIYIQTLDYAGRDLDTYYWIDWGDPTGWCIDYTIVDDVTFPAGTGLWITGVTDADNIQMAGEVSKQDTVVRLRWGATPTGNTFPVAVNLQDILPEGKSISTDGDIYIQTLDYAGRDLDTYYWIDWGDPTGWCIDYTIVENVSFEPGTGLWVTAVSDADYLRIPSPIPAE